MSRFEKVCEDCPLRTKVDVVRSSEGVSWGTDGAKSRLSDGVNYYDVTLTEGGVYDSWTARAVNETTERQIDECEGPQESLLRRKCAVGLASAWRWTEEVGEYEPNISSPEDLLGVLGDANYLDAMPRFDVPTFLVGDPSEFSEIDRGDRSAFNNCAIRKVTRTVIGSSAKLEKGKAVMLDRVSPLVEGSDLRNWFRIRVAQGGPVFTFQSNVEISYDNSSGKRATSIDQVLAEGIFAYLFSDEDAVKKSDELIKLVEAAADKNFREMEEGFATFMFGQAVKSGKGRKKRKK